jgi:hypothetical protein
MIKGNEYGMNKLAKKFLDDEMYLSEEEKSVKEKIEEIYQGILSSSCSTHPETKSKLTNGMLQSFPRDSLQNRQTPRPTQR